MKTLKKILLIIFGLIIVLVMFSVWYSIKYSMGIVDNYEVNSPKLEKSLLIATQGSVFKAKVTEAVVNHYKSDAVFIKVIDIGNLDQINPDDFSALLIIHTWENWKPPLEVKSFIERTKSSADKIVVLTTSGQGSYKMDGVDAITGESIIEDASLFTKQIFERLNPLLRITNHKN